MASLIRSKILFYTRLTGGTVNSQQSVFNGGGFNNLYRFIKNQPPAQIVKTIHQATQNFIFLCPLEILQNQEKQTILL